MYDSDVILFRIHWSMYSNNYFSTSRLDKVIAKKIKQCSSLPRHVVGYTVYMITRSSTTAEIARVGDHYAVQGHSRSLILVPVESPYATSYLWIILTDILSCTIF